MPIPDRADEPASLSMSSTEPSIPVGGLQELDGHFAFQTDLKDTFLTAVAGGGRTTDTIHTDATEPRSWERFQLWSTNVLGFYGIQTLNGHFVTAVAAGGRTTDTIHTDATVVQSWELFAPTRLFDAFNDFMGFGLKTSLYKSVPITERVGLRIGVDAFNVFNQPGLALPDPTTVILSLRVSGQGARTLNTRRG